MEAAAENTWMFPGAWILEDLGWLVFIGHVLREANIPHARINILNYLNGNILNYLKVIKLSCDLGTVCRFPPFPLFP